MLTLTRKTEYALIALTHLSQSSEGCISAREIAGCYGLPLPLLMNVLKILSQCGLVTSVRGPRGGYILAVDAGKITLNDIIQAVEGPVQLVQCEDPDLDGEKSAGQSGCQRTSCCPVRSPIHRIQDRMIHFLQKVTLADIAGETANGPLVGLGVHSGE